MHDTSTFVQNKTRYKWSVKFKASKPESTVEKKKLAYKIVYLTNILLFCTTLKQRSASTTFF